MYINFWYPVGRSEEITSDAPFRTQILGLHFVAFRDGDGQAHVLSDTCTHRGGALGKGWVKDDCVVCPYHGWRFSGDGKCIAIPALGPGAKSPPRAKVDQEAKAAKPKPKKMPAPAPKEVDAASAKIAPPTAKDDLTKIKGIGPALQRELQNMGFHTFQQLSELNPEQIEEVNTQIGFPGRVERENWIGQARELAA